MELEELIEHAASLSKNNSVQITVIKAGMGLITNVHYFRANGTLGRASSSLDVVDALEQAIGDMEA